MRAKTMRVPSGVHVGARSVPAAWVRCLRTRPPERTTRMSLNPSPPTENAIQRLSGDQAGEELSPEKTRHRLLPSARATSIPPDVDKATIEPSGDQEGTP